MKILLLVIGKTDEDYLITGIKKYVGRLGHYASFKMKEIPDPRNRKTLSEEQQKIAESLLILSQLQPSDQVILLDENGKQFTSVNFAESLEKQMVSLSPMTFSHQMVRLIFVEQLYRAFTILKGEPYHHQ